MSDVLSLVRKIYTDRSTVGDLLLRGEPFCSTIELSCRKGDEKGLLAILPGRYQFTLTKSPHLGFVTPLLLNVPKNDGPGFRIGIRIHPANWAEQLDGCIAPGDYRLDEPNFVANSRVAFNRLMSELEPLPEENLWITITNGGLPKIT